MKNTEIRKKTEREYIERGIPYQFIVLKNNFTFKHYAEMEEEIRAGEIVKAEKNSAYSIVDVTNKFSNLGKELFNMLDTEEFILNKQYIRELLFGKIDHTKYEKIVNMIIKFCKDYGFPYEVANYKKQREYYEAYSEIYKKSHMNIEENICGSFPIIDFVYDVILIYLVIKIHMVEFNGLGASTQRQKTQCFIQKILKHLEHINVEKNSNNKGIVKNKILELIQVRINSNAINTSNIYYNEEQEKYVMYLSSSSLIGIAFYGMVLYAMDDYCEKVKLCRNPECINFINTVIAESKSPYCEWCQSNNIRNKKKSANYYKRKKNQNK